MRLLRFFLSVKNLGCMRLLILIGIACWQSTTSSSNGSAEDFVFVAKRKDLIEGDYVVVSPLDEATGPGDVEDTDAGVVDVCSQGISGEEVFAPLKRLLAKPSTRVFLKKLAQGYSKSLLGQVTPPLKDAHKFLLKNRQVFLPLFVILLLIYNDPILRGQLLKAGIPQYFIHDAVWSSLSNGAVPEISNFMGICESLASFTTVGLPVSLLGTNWKTYQFTFALINLLKGFNQLVAKNGK